MQSKKRLYLATAIMLLGVGGLFSVATAEDHKSKDHEHKAVIGKPAPDFELTGIDGKQYNLSDFKDKIVVLEWFNMRCPFVVAASENMAKAAKKYTSKNGKPVVWLAIDSTNPEHRDYRKPEEIKEYCEAKGIEYPILKDPEGKVGKMYGAKTTPHMFIINKGTLVYMGGHDDGRSVQPGDRNYIAETLDALLADKDVPSERTRNRGCSVKY